MNTNELTIMDLINIDIKLILKNGKELGFKMDKSFSDSKIPKELKGKIADEIYKELVKWMDEIE